MPKFRPKQKVVEARQHHGPTFTVIHDIKGEQHAKKGDWLVGSEKGKVEVLSDAAFREAYEPIESKEK